MGACLVENITGTATDVETPSDEVVVAVIV